MLTVKSGTSGQPLNAIKLEESRIRKSFILPHIKLRVAGTNLRGLALMESWYYPEDITEVSNEGESLIKQIDILEAYLFLRKNNHSIPDETLEFIKVAAMEKLPYLIEVSHEGLTYGVAHAGVPEELSWQELAVAVQDDNKAAKQECVWMRDYVEYEEYYRDNFCKGVDYTISGHTPVREPKLIANRLHIDTGLVYGKYLTITEASAEGFTHHKVMMKEGT